MQCESCLSLWCGRSQGMSDQPAAVQEISRSVTTQPLGPSGGFGRAQGQPGNAGQPRLGGNSRPNLMDTARRDRGGTSMVDTAMREPTMWERPVMSSLMDSARSPWDFGRSGPPPSFPVSLSPLPPGIVSLMSVSPAGNASGSPSAAHLPPAVSDQMTGAWACRPDPLERPSKVHCRCRPPMLQAISSPSGRPAARQPCRSSDQTPSRAWRPVYPSSSLAGSLNTSGRTTTWTTSQAAWAASATAALRRLLPGCSPLTARWAACLLPLQNPLRSNICRCLQDWGTLAGVFVAIVHTCNPVSVDEDCFVHAGPMVNARCLRCRRLPSRILQAAPCRLLRPKRQSCRRESLRRPPPSRLSPRAQDQKNSAGRSLVQAPSRKFGTGAHFLAHLGLQKWTTFSGGLHGV